MSSKPKSLVVHKGALGDFLQIWPSLYALTRYHKPGDIFWAGRFEYQLWTKPLGIETAPWHIIRAVDRLYSVTSWPKELEGWQIYWFGLKKPPSTISFPRLYFLQAIDSKQAIHVRENYLQQLQQMDIPACAHWHQAWLEFFATQHIDQEKIHILPGAGHKAKCWPLDNYLQLASRLQTQGLCPVFVLGPVERERGMEVQGFESVQPGSLAELQEILAGSGLVVGNDSGPLHLAAYLGRPTLVLFGPSCPLRWAQFQADIFRKNPGCSPCSLTARIDCQDPVCMRLLSIQEVYSRIQELLASQKTKPASQESPLRSRLWQKEEGSLNKNLHKRCQVNTTFQLKKKTNISIG
ncbi:MAG: glycosyltransferase family 9 protein [Desulfohalobiaceae bacterium]